MGKRASRCFPSKSKPGKLIRVDGVEYSGQKADWFDCLPDDIVLSILCCLSASAERPSDLVSVMETCKRMNSFRKNPLVLQKASLKSISIRAENWSPPAHEFLKRCADAGNLEACYLLGMIECYCFRMIGDGRRDTESTRKGLKYLLLASQRGHAPATYSLAVIFFNSTRMGKSEENLSTGFSLCQRAARLGYVDAIRELGHCLQDGYGVTKDVPRGSLLLINANSCDRRSVASSQRRSRSLGSAPEAVHPANRFMAEWFRTRQNHGESDVVGVRVCANGKCSRPETRRYEFRVCSMCTLSSYCSRACQDVHWRTSHVTACPAIARYPIPYPYPYPYPITLTRL